MSRRNKVAAVIVTATVLVMALTALQTASDGVLRWVAGIGVGAVAVATGLSLRRLLRRDR